MDRRFCWWLVLLVAAGLALRVGYVFLLERGETAAGDAIYYHHQANALAQGRGFVDPLRSFFWARPLATAYHPPLYPLVLALTSVFGATSFLAHQLLTCLLGAATVAVLGLFARSVVGPSVGLVVAAVAALHPNLWVSDGLVLPETPYALTVGLALWAAYAFLRAPSARRAAVVGIALGVAALVRGEAVGLVAVLGVPLALSAADSGRRRLIVAGAMASSAALVMAPWVVRNLLTFEEPVLLSTNGGTTLAAANCDATYEGEAIGFFSLSCWSGQTDPAEDSVRDRVWRERGASYLTEHADQVPAVVAARLGRVWEVYRPWQNRRHDEFEERNIAVAWAGLVTYWLLVPASALGLVELHRRHVRVWPLLTPFVLVIIVTAVFYGNTRFRIPAEVAMVVLGGIGISSAPGWWRRHRSLDAARPTVPSPARTSPDGPGRKGFDVPETPRTDSDIEEQVHALTADRATVL